MAAAVAIAAKQPRVDLGYSQFVYDLDLRDGNSPDMPAVDIAALAEPDHLSECFAVLQRPEHLAELLYEKEPDKAVVGLPVAYVDLGGFAGLAEPVDQAKTVFDLVAVADCSRSLFHLFVSLSIKTNDRTIISQASKP